MDFHKKKAPKQKKLVHIGMFCKKHVLEVLMAHGEVQVTTLSGEALPTETLCNIYKCPEHPMFMVEQKEKEEGGVTITVPC